MSADESVPVELREKLRDMDWNGLVETIFGMVLNGSGIHALVLSMMRPEHLRANVRAVDENRFSREDFTLMRERLLRSPTTAPRR